MQADAWPGATGTSGTSCCVQASMPVGAARRKTAAGRRRAQVGRQALDGLELDAARQVEPRDRAHQADRVRVRGLEEHIVGRALLDDARRIHHVHAVGVARHDAEIVRDDDQRDAEPARQVLHQFEDLRLDRDVERGGRLVGDDELGIAGKPDRDHHALAHAAGEMMRILLEPARPVGDADELQQLERARRAPASSVILRWMSRGSITCSPIERTGLSEVIGSWKIIEMSRPRISRISSAESAEQVAPVERDAALRHPAGLGEQAHDRERGDRLAAAGFARRSRRSRPD